MNEPNSKFRQYLFIATYVIIFSYLLLNLSGVTQFILKTLSVLSPLTVGIGIAFILNIPMMLFENHIFAFLDNQKSSFIRGLKRPLSIFTTLILVFGFMIGLILFIIPQLADSVSTLGRVIPGYANSAEKLLDKYINSSELFNRIGNEVLIAWKDFAKIGGNLLSTSLSKLLTMTLGFTSSIFNFFLSVVLALYMLSSKEKLIIQLKKMLFAFLKKEYALKVIHVGRIANVTFHHFIAGQFTEALILGVLCFVGMSVLSMPYALLISVIVAVTGLIPVFGAFIGTVPSAFIIFILNPVQALWFILFIIVLQQVEGNLIYPRVVGNSIGLSGLWVMVAMLIGGSMMGILGILLGIPIFSVLYQLLRTEVQNKLKAKVKVNSPAK